MKRRRAPPRRGPSQQQLEQEYGSARVLSYAAQLLDLPANARSDETFSAMTVAATHAFDPPRPLQMAPGERFNLAAFLWMLSQKRAAIEAIKKAMASMAITQHGRPRAPSWRIAVDYHIALEKHGMSKRGRSDALGEVMSRWGVKRSTILTAYKNCSRHRDWEKIVRGEYLPPSTISLYEYVRIMGSNFRNPETTS